MQTLENMIATYEEAKRKKVSAEILAEMARGTEELESLGIEDRALRVGDTMFDFSLPNQHGEVKRFGDYLQESVVVLNIYRGGWCPYCNLEMKALCNALPEIESNGARLIGMAPETPDKALATAERNRLAIDILSDAGNRTAERMGLVFDLPQALRPIYEQIGIDIPAFNGDDSFRLPVPATYIVGQDGRIRYAFVNVDYTRRLEPGAIVSQLRGGC